MALAKEQGVPTNKLILRRPEGLSRGSGARWKRKLPPTVCQHITSSHQLSRALNRGNQAVVKGGHISRAKQCRAKQCMLMTVDLYYTLWED